MAVLGGLNSFEWDKGNVDKSYQKHGITPSQAEEIFLDENLKVIKDIKHSQDEDRFIAIGKTFENKTLFVVFAFRKDKIRIISARKANIKERRKYKQSLIHLRRNKQSLFSNENEKAIKKNP